MSHPPLQLHAPPSAILLVDGEQAALPHPRIYRCAHPNCPSQMHCIGRSPVSSPTNIKTWSAHSVFNLSYNTIHLRASEGQCTAIRGNIRSTHDHAISAPAPVVFEYHSPVSACFVNVCADTFSLQSSWQLAVLSNVPVKAHPLVTGTSHHYLLVAGPL
ncbi:hypothetical protein IEO21_10889 [Rhodonia placenta]|uniref:Uncharacterized protein n=1 Tax=Rhodonia placenta TaxID=104341 RepID=A0A8H7NRL5_9APHY|nr:hypothetical protein IEO21_10889 [Postia placenta]